jgi:leucyl aminopeptidase
MAPSVKARAALPFPKSLAHRCNATKATAKLSKDNIQANLERFSAFHNRYYMSNWGVQSTEWLHGQIRAVLDQFGHPSANVRFVSHMAWAQPSIVVTLPGQTARTVVVGGHLDSIISGDRGTGRASGAGAFVFFFFLPFFVYSFAD